MSKFLFSKRFPRRVSSRSESKKIYIFTEGIVTEPTYFKSLKNSLRKQSIDLRIVGVGRQSYSLVTYAERKISEEEIKITGKNSDEVWVVFDTDTRSDILKAINKARSLGINYAVVNECFELWYLLHFEFMGNDIGRHQYPAKLTKHIKSLTGDVGFKYEKNSSIFEILKPKIDVAIKNSKKLLKSYSSPDDLHLNCPSTNLHILIEKLIKI